MPLLKERCVALLMDVVSSRAGDRRALHAAVTAAVELANARVESVDALRPTVGDEVQGVFPTLGAALEAAFTLRLELAPDRDVRFGLGVGTVEVIDEERGIQDGTAWWGAREAVEWVRDLAARPGHESARTAIRGQPAATGPVVDAAARLVDAHLSRLRPGAVVTLRGMWAGQDNAAVAAGQGISESANSQRVRNNQLRPLLDAMAALSAMP